eukprot:CAMPEP_0202832254 /NCGR_PEP_ID=MMETSP1389-20130828/17442_1 /ASSEMBLY_ACC=CAM_ASM_000865 /TAXON_ID=302021 /ORGANISM="Rhodomonas sp., Strain CCMP768" /LENGTH=95 /DNA_ID=CAMNT_0049506053 /DNA_START=28 /DNA_END=312 /DNA_ORIENTATION=-
MIKLGSSSGWPSRGREDSDAHRGPETTVAARHGSTGTPGRRSRTSSSKSGSKFGLVSIRVASGRINLKGPVRRRRGGDAGGVDEGEEIQLAEGSA